MSTQTLYRASGAALAVGAVLVVISLGVENVFLPDMQSTPLPILLMNALGDLLVVLSLPSIAALLSARSGWAGFTGSVLTLVGLLLFTCMSFVQIIDQQLMAQLTQLAPKVAASDGPPISAMITSILASALFGLGGILLGIALIRSNIWPRWTGLFLLIGSVLNFVSFPLNGVIGGIVGTLANLLYCAAMCWIGYELLTTTTKEGEMGGIVTSHQTRA